MYGFFQYVQPQSKTKSSEGIKKRAKPGLRLAPLTNQRTGLKKNLLQNILPHESEFIYLHVKSDVQYCRQHHTPKNKQKKQPNQ